MIHKSTQYLRAEEDLRFQKSLLESLSEAALDGILSVSTQGKILSFNRRFVQMWGIPSEVIASRSHEAALRSVLDQVTNPEGFMRQVEYLYANPREVSQEEVQLKDGRTFDRYSAPITRGEGGPSYGRVWFFRDVTDRKRAEKKKAELEEHFRQSQKMEAVGRLAGGVAHDFNNLLTAILGYSDVILARAGLDPASRMELMEVKRAGERAAQLTRQLLAFSRRQPIRPKILDLNEVARGIESMLRRLIPEAIRVELAPQLEDMWIKADPGQVDQVILNLSINARDAMPKGGLLRIGTNLIEVGPEFVRRHPGSAAGRYVVLSVSDTGIGIPKETLAHLFEPYFTTKEIGKGTGLGLATVYGITKQSGGFLTVASDPGKGTTFRVYLPRVEERPQAPNDSQVVATISGTERILLVEDDAAVRGFVAQGLKAHGYVVSVAECPEEAIRIWKSLGGNLDLLLTDVVMPGKSGRELARELMASQHNLGVVYMSGYTEDVALREGRIEPGAGFIAKPFVIADLLVRIRKTLAKVEARDTGRARKS